MTDDLAGLHAAPPVRAPLVGRPWGTTRLFIMAAAFLSGLAGTTLSSDLEVPTSGFASSPTKVQEPISPLPLSMPLDEGKVRLGERLFADSRLSSGNGISCASCHMPAFGMTDGRSISSGLPGYPGITNSLTILNVGFNTQFSWSGQTLSLEEQADKVIEAKRTMGGSWEEVVATLSGDDSVAAEFKQNFPDGVTRKNIVDSLVAYEKSLITPNAPFDRYLRGETDAISEDAKNGYQIFKDYGCVSCHQGINVGGNMMQVFGIFGSPPSITKGAETAGSAHGSGIADDKPVFRVPPLRNVADTAPYFHDGSAKSLSEAISLMATYQLGREISDDDVSKLESFLKSLSGDVSPVLSD
ncbi:cytochrome c peroxidase [Ensifer sp. Root31]|uniref:cytochrome c peroxidase n=1 Tax=Ensifer sp. Root31 TaxID=1736512 RepID=UPI0009EAC2CC